MANVEVICPICERKREINVTTHRKYQNKKEIICRDCMPDVEENDPIPKLYNYNVICPICGRNRTIVYNMFRALYYNKLLGTMLCKSCGNHRTIKGKQPKYIELQCSICKKNRTVTYTYYKTIEDVENNVCKKCVLVGFNETIDYITKYKAPCGGILTGTPTVKRCVYYDLCLNKLQCITVASNANWVGFIVVEPIEPNLVTIDEMNKLEEQCKLKSDIKSGEFIKV